MAKRTTKADIILQGAQERLAKAEAIMNKAQSDFGVAQMVYGALLLEYNALKDSLTRATPSAPKPRAPRKDKGTKRGLPSEDKSNGQTTNPPPED